MGNRLSLWSLLAIGLSYSIYALLQLVAVASFGLLLTKNQEGEWLWSLGLVYLLFCLFLSGINALSLYFEGPSRLIEQSGGIALASLNHAQARTVKNILAELSPTEKLPPVYLLPAREINAFTLNISHSESSRNRLKSPLCIAITQGAVQQLSRTMLKTLLARQLHAQRSSIKPLMLCISLSGFCSLFCSGQVMLRQAGLGRLGRWLGNTTEYKESKQESKGHPLFFLGFIPLVLGLPGWWLSRLMLLWLPLQEVIKQDLAIVTSRESGEALSSALIRSTQFPFDDLSTKLWLLRSIAFQSSGFLEELLPTQPSIKRRLQAIEKKSASLPFNRL